MKYSRLLGYLLFLFVLFTLPLVSCASELQSVDQNINSLKYFSNEFIADQVPPGSQNLSDEMLSQYRNAKTVQILVNQSYEEAPDVSFPFREIAEGLLAQYVGLKIVSTGGDLTFSVDAKGKALSASYMGRGTQYSGAQLSGKIFFHIHGKPSYEKSFESRMKPGSLISGSYPTPSLAPFWFLMFPQDSETWEGSFIQTFVKLLGEIYGTSFLIETLQRKNPHVTGDDYICAYGINELGRLRKKEAIEPLLEVLIKWDDYYKSVKLQAIRALGSIADISSAVPLMNYWKTLDDAYFLEEISKTLIQIGPASLEPLISYLKAEQLEWKSEYAWKAINKITKIDFSKDLGKLLNWWEQNKDKN